MESPLADRRQLRLRDLHSQPIILFPRDRNPGLFAQIVGGIPKLSRDRILEASSRQTAIMIAAANLGVAVISESMHPMCPDSVKCLPLWGSSLGVDIVIG